VRGWGLMNGLVLRDDSPVTSMEIVKGAMHQGLLTVPAGPKVVRFVPPLIVTAEEIDRAVQLLSLTLAKLIVD